MINWLKKKKITVMIILCIVVIGGAVCVYTDIGQGEEYTQDGIIQTFNNNYSTFVNIAQMTENDPTEFYCYTSEKLVNEKNSEEIDINILIEKELILYIINGLKFKSISEDSDQIKFLKVSGGVEKGVKYMKNGIVPENIPVNKAILIKDNWYYYEIYHT